MVRDVMVQLPQIEYVGPGDEAAASRLVGEKRYSVVPVSDDGKTFNSVFCTVHEANDPRRITRKQQTSISDHIPDSTPLADAFSLFDSREWYLTLRDNRVSGLITYWAFNSREFRVQLYAGLSRVEELSRDVLAMDGCGLIDKHVARWLVGAAKKLKSIWTGELETVAIETFLFNNGIPQLNAALTKHPTVAQLSQ